MIPCDFLDACFSPEVNLNGQRKKAPAERFEAALRTTVLDLHRVGDWPTLILNLLKLDKAAVAHYFGKVCGLHEVVALEAHESCPLVLIIVRVVHRHDLMLELVVIADAK